MKSPEPPIRDAILETLRDHPFLSRRQLELYLGRPGRTVRQGLTELQALKWVGRINSRQPWLHTRWLFSLTPAGVAELACRANLSPSEFASRAQLSSARLCRLVLLMDRDFQLRTIFLWLSQAGNAGTDHRRSSGKATSRKTGSGTRNNATRSNAEDRTWYAATWDVEIGKVFATRGRAAWIPFHGGALMRRGPERSPSTLLRSQSPRPQAGVNHVVSEANPSAESKDERWAFVVVELDLGRVPVERDCERLAHLVAAQDDPRYWGKDKEQIFPVLLVIAHDELRLQDYFSVLRASAMARQLPMPRAYLTTFDALVSISDGSHNTRAIWYSTISGRQTSLLFDTEGVAMPFPAQVPWRKLPINSADAGELFDATAALSLANSQTNPTHDATNVPLAKGASSAIVDARARSPRMRRTSSVTEFAGISLTLKPLAKVLLNEIAAHPLLAQNEVALLLRAPLRRVQPALVRMTELKLIEAHDSRYLPTFKGQHYLALASGFGNAVRRYARARGWGKGFSSLLRHWQHTREENKFFLHLASIARTRRHALRWLSELESRLYFEAGHSRHSFLPDGRGSYVAGRECYEFAVEIDRSKSSQERFRRKLAEYEACVSSNVLRSEGIELLRVLVITNSWERAETWRRAGQEARVGFPIVVTTFDRLYASGADAPIWLRIDGRGTGQSAAVSPKCYCFECFALAKKLYSVLSQAS